MNHEQTAENLSKESDITQFGPDERIEKDYKLNYVGSGAYRDVYTDGKIVYKLGNKDANNDEYEYYHRSNENLKKLLAPALYISENSEVIVAEYVPEQVTDSEVDEFEQKHGHLLDDLIWDLKSINVRKSNGTLKVVDYQTQHAECDSEM